MSILKCDVEQLVFSFLRFKIVLRDESDLGTVKRLAKFSPGSCVEGTITCMEESLETSLSMATISEGGLGYSREEERDGILEKLSRRPCIIISMINLSPVKDFHWGRK